MKLPHLRRKLLIIPIVAGAAALAIGATVWTSTAEDQVDGPERDRVAAAAVEAAGGGSAVEVETSDDRGEAYEVEVRLKDGREVEVGLDADLGVLSKEEENGDDEHDGRDGDGRSLSPTERTSAERSALRAVGGGTVSDVEAGDDPGVAYEVEVIDAKNREWDVDLDAGFAVVGKARDR